MRAFQTRRSGCSFIHADGGRRNPVFSAAALMPSAGIASLINRRLFMALSALTPGCARAFGRYLPVYNERIAIRWKASACLKHRRRRALSLHALLARGETPA